MILSCILAYLISTRYQRIKIKVREQKYSVSSAFAIILILFVIVVISLLSVMKLPASNIHLPLSYPFILHYRGGGFTLYLFNISLFRLASILLRDSYDWNHYLVLIAPYYFFVVFLMINTLGAVIGIHFGIYRQTPDFRRDAKYTYMALFWVLLKGILSFVVYYPISSLIYDIFLSDAIEHVLTILHIKSEILGLDPVIARVTAEVYFFLIPLYIYITIAPLEKRYLLHNVKSELSRKIFAIDFTTLVALTINFYWFMHWSGILDYLFYPITLLSFWFIMTIISVLATIAGWTLIAYFITSNHYTSAISRKKKRIILFSSLGLVVLPMSVYLYVRYPYIELWYILHFLLLISVWVLMVASQLTDLEDNINITKSS